jgi:hypothetical protein
MKSFTVAGFNIIAALSLACGVSTAYGSILVAPTGPTAPDSWSSCTGCTILNSISSSGSAGSELGFLYGAAVLTNDPSNPFGINDLDFIYSLLNNATSLASIARATASGLTGFSTDVGYFTAAAFPGGSIAPNTVDRNSADTVGFNFTSLSPGQESLVFVVKTNATTFGNGTLNVMGSAIDGGPGTVAVAAFSPTVAPIPEPNLAWLAGAAILAMAAIRRFKVSKVR